MEKEREIIRNFDSFHSFFPEYLRAEKRREPEAACGRILWQKTLLADLLPPSLLTEDRRYVPLLAPFFDELDSFAAPQGTKFDAFWERGRLFFHDLLNERMEELTGPPSHFHPGDSIGYDKPIPPVLPAEWGRLHFTNARRPESFLDDEKYFADNLLRVLDESEKEFGYTIVTSFTWLNALPKFLRFFPESWRKNTTDIRENEIRNDLGFLGQLVNSSGMLNRKVADHLVETGRLPYAPRRCRCTYGELRKHLQQFL